MKNIRVGMALITDWMFLTILRIIILTLDPRAGGWMAFVSVFSFTIFILGMLLMMKPERMSVCYSPSQWSLTRRFLLALKRFKENPDQKYNIKNDAEWQAYGIAHRIIPIEQIGYY